MTPEMNDVLPTRMKDRDVVPDWADIPQECLVCGWVAVPAVRHRVYLVFVCRNCYTATETSRREINQRMAERLRSVISEADAVESARKMVTQDD